ncbi:hypothetical protein ACFQZ4_50015 [Catellatospora coxensis]
MSESQPLDAADFDLLDQIRDLHETADPMPADLVERSLFALASRQLAAEIARLQAQQPVAARSTEHTRTLTFEAHSLTIMITLTETGGGGCASTAGSPRPHRCGSNCAAPPARRPPPPTRPAGSRSRRSNPASASSSSSATIPTSRGSSPQPSHCDHPRHPGPTSGSVTGR